MWENICMGLCFPPHILKKEMKQKQVFKRVYFRYTLTYMFMCHVLFSDPRSRVRRRNKSLRRYCQIAEYICTIIMVLRQSSAVVYVVFYDDIELIRCIGGKYDDHYDSKVRYKTFNKNEHVQFVLLNSYFQLQDQLKDVPSITYTYRQPRSSILILQPLEVTLDVKLDQRASSSDDGPDVKTQADDNNSLADSSSVDKILAKS